MVPALAIRAMLANRTKTSGIAGKIRCRNCLSGEAPAPANTVTGSHFSSTPNTTSSTIPDELRHRRRDSPVTEMARSWRRSRACSAEIFPPRMPSGTTITKASTASLTELISAARMKGSTAVR